jgi:ketosteroid isomerase-like protein
VEGMTSADAAAVLQANEAFYRAFAAKDYQAMDALWARSIEVASVHPLGELVQGREWVMETWRLIFENPEQPRVVMGDAQAVTVGDFGYVTCREFTAGAALVSTNLYVREEGEWHIAHHHSSHVVLMQD